LGAVSGVVRDSWTGDIRKFSVKTQLADTDLFYSIGDVSEASETKVKLKIAFGEVNTSIRFGAKVFDKNNKYLGTVDYSISDSFTGEVKKFRVKTESIEESLLFSTEDIEKSAPDEIRLNIESPNSPKP
jgi:hypothetical protein